MVRGLTTVSFWTDDVPAAREWYSELLGMEPYFQRPDAEHPAYIEFRIGDYQHELGIIDKKYAPTRSETEAATEKAGAVIYWHVDNLEETFEKLLSMGAQEYEAPQKRGEGFVTASVIDPFGNILGIMYNAHYLEILSSFRNSTAE